MKGGPSCWLIASAFQPGLLLNPAKVRELLKGKGKKKNEARVGIEPTNTAFAEPCLTTWLPRRDLKLYSLAVSLTTESFWEVFLISCFSFDGVLFLGLPACLPSPAIASYGNCVQISHHRRPHFFIPSLSRYGQIFIKRDHEGISGRKRLRDRHCSFATRRPKREKRSFR